MYLQIQLPHHQIEKTFYLFVLQNGFKLNNPGLGIFLFKFLMGVSIKWYLHKVKKVKAKFHTKSIMDMHTLQLHL